MGKTLVQQEIWEEVHGKRRNKSDMQVLLRNLQSSTILSIDLNSQAMIRV
jgi:hypothetical protein